MLLPSATWCCALVSLSFPAAHSISCHHLHKTTTANYFSVSTHSYSRAAAPCFCVLFLGATSAVFRIVTSPQRQLFLFLCPPCTLSQGLAECWVIAQCSGTPSYVGAKVLSSSYFLSSLVPNIWIFPLLRCLLIDSNSENWKNGISVTISASQTSFANNKPAQADNMMTLRCVQDYAVLQSQSKIRRRGVMNSGVLCWPSNGPILSSYDFL